MTLKAKAAKKTRIKAKKAFSVTKAKGKLSYAKVKGSKKITVNKKTGRIIVKKGLKKGRVYKVKVRITAAGNANYIKKFKVVKVRVKVV